MQIGVFIAVHRINLYAHHLKVLASQLTSFPNIAYSAHFAAFAGQNEDFLHTGFGDGLHFGYQLLPVKTCSVNAIVAIKAAVNTVILAIVGDIKGRKEGHVIAEIALALLTGLLGYFFQQGQRSRGKQGREIIRGSMLLRQSSQHVSRCIAAVIIAVACCADLL